MKYCLILISLVLSQLLNAQKGNTFTVGMSSGIGMTNNKTIGENKPLDNLSNIHTSLNASYGIQLPKNLRCDINFGLENISYFPYPAYIGRSSGSILLSNLGAGLHYKMPVKKNFFSIGLNGGVRFIRNAESSYSTYSDQSYSKTIYTFEKSLNPFISLQLGYEFPLKNKNLLGIDLSFKGSFRPIYSMEYNFSNFVSFSNGSYSYSGNSVHLGIHYTWTKNKKNAEINTLLLDSVDRKEAKKLVAIKNRFQSSKAILIQLHQGGFMNQCKFLNYSGDVFKNATGPGSSTRLNATIGWKNNWSFQPGVSIDSYWLWIRNQKYATGLSGSSLFNLFTLDLGMQRRMLSFPKTNRYLCNVNGGISLSYLSGIGSGSGGAEFTTDPINTNQVILTYNYSYHYNNKLFPTAYLGISKDLRLSNHILFTIAYRHQFGLSRGMIIPFSYTETNQAPVNTQIRVNGNANCISFGLAYRFNNKR